MNLVHLIGMKQEMDDVLKKMIATEVFQPVEARDILKEPHLLQDKQQQSIYNSYFRRIETLLEKLQVEKHFTLNDTQKEINLNKLEEYVSSMEEKLSSIEKQIEEIRKEKEYLFNVKQHMLGFGDFEIQIERLSQMDFINVHFGKMHIDNYKRLFKNITDIPFIVKSIHQQGEMKWLFIFALKHQEERAQKILSSLYFEEIDIPKHFIGTPQSIIQNIDLRVKELNLVEEELQFQIKRLALVSEAKLQTLYSELLVHKKVESLKGAIGETRAFFYITGWVPDTQLSFFTENIQKCSSIMMEVQKAEKVELKKQMKIPTKLENAKWFKPFESIVKLYGTPSYNEVDPTPLVALTFLLFYGIMFGDVGQGLVISLVGYLMYRYTSTSNRNLGTVIMVSGGMATAFGFLYGDVFGFEHVLPALWIRPMEKINYTLIAAISLGVIFISLAIGINMYKQYKTGHKANFWLDKNGFAGLAFYWLCLFTILYYVTSGHLWGSSYVIVPLIIVPLLTVYLKEPLEHRMEKHKEKLHGEYYFLAFFEVYEVILGFFSNTLSFIRLGAFALNHVGLMMAIHILSELASSETGSIVTIILGNVLVIGLEGLIVGIQALRLNFYELFSRFYEGEGQEYNPVTLQEGRL